MNGGGGGRGGRGKMAAPPPPGGLKDRDNEYLSLFREMRKREKDGVISLLQPVSDEFEATGNYALYRMAPKRGSSEYELPTGIDKNDYDWLKTPPATPLFPSLETEANAPDTVLQRELPIVQPLSRFAGNTQAKMGDNRISKSPATKPKVPTRPITPNTKEKNCFLSTEKKRDSKCAPTSNHHKVNHPSLDLLKKLKPINQKESHYMFFTPNISKCIGIDSRTKPESIGVSPLLTSKTPAQKAVPEFSNETPRNLRTDSRSSSASRGQLVNQTLSNHQHLESTMKMRRQSCSPSVTRGRKVEVKQEHEGIKAVQRSRVEEGNGKQVVGSRMVDKFLNSRKSVVEERESKQRLNGSTTKSIAANPGRVGSRNSSSTTS